MVKKIENRSTFAVTKQHPAAALHTLADPCVLQLVSGVTMAFPCNLTSS